MTLSKNAFCKLHPADNVAVALRDIGPGEYQELKVRDHIRKKHKFTLTSLSEGDEIRLYGVPVGRMKMHVLSGTLLSQENVCSIDAPLLFDYKVKPTANFEYSTAATFSGIVRADGKVGTANYWLLVPLVFCENRNVEIIGSVLSRTLGYEKPSKYERYATELIGSVHNNQEMPSRVFPHLDGIRSLSHHGGCGGTREDAESLIRILLAYIHHPNVAGATVLALGCENAQLEWFHALQDEHYPHSDKPVICIHQQDRGSEDNFIRTAIKETLSAMSSLPVPVREDVGLDRLVVGLECGGSDGFSGITANPLLGRISDRINACGGATILSEFPELHGMETHLMQRCKDRALAEKFFDLQQSYKRRLQALGIGFDSNPSPGNIREGLITSEMKSAGAVAKAGMSSVSGVLDYLEPVKEPGLHLLCTPGNDVESTTAMVASGANMILFTTGMGTPTGNPIVPVIKISSNTSLWERMPDIIDFDAGVLIDAPHAMDETADRLEKLIIRAASAYPVNAMNLGQHDFIPWKRGISL